MFDEGVNPQDRQHDRRRPCDQHVKPPQTLASELADHLLLHPSAMSAGDGFVFGVQPLLKVFPGAFLRATLGAGLTDVIRRAGAAMSHPRQLVEVLLLTALA